MGKIKLVIFILLSCSLEASAIMGTVVGNGGDAVVCRNADHSIRSVELLDFYEAKVERGFQIRLNPNRSLTQNLQVLKERLGHHDRFLKEKMTKKISVFFENAVIIPGIELEDIKDSDHISMPSGCKVEQVAIQRPPRFPGEKYFTISKDLWDRMDSANQAGLILHEVLYQNLLENSDSRSINSIAIRYFTALVAAEKLSLLSFKEYLEFIKNEIKIYKTNIDNFLVSIDKVNFEADSDEITGFEGVAEKDQTVVVTEDLSVVARQGHNFKYRRASENSSAYYAIKHLGQGQVFRVNQKTLRFAEDFSEFWVDAGVLTKISGVGVSYTGPIQVGDGEFLDCGDLQFHRTEDSKELDGTYDCRTMQAYTLTPGNLHTLEGATYFKFNSENEVTLAQKSIYEFSFYDSGEVKERVCKVAVRCQRLGHHEVSGYGTRALSFRLMLGENIIFHKSGMLKTATIGSMNRYGDPKYTLRFALGPYVVGSSLNELSLHSNGQLAEAKLVFVPKDVAAPASDGSYIPIKNGMEVKLDRLGKVLVVSTP